MPNYRRAYIAGGCWLSTVNLHDRRASLLVEHIEILRGAVAETSRRFPFEIDAMVVLPDHIHAIFSLPADGADFSTRWRLIKARFARTLPAHESRNATHTSRNERGIWQRRFWEHLIRNEADYARHVDYCYINPVKRGLVGRVQDWPHSPFHRDVRRGLVPIDWAGDVNCPGEFGEPK